MIRLIFLLLICLSAFVGNAENNTSDHLRLPQIHQQDNLDDKYETSPILLMQDAILEGKTVLNNLIKDYNKNFQSIIDIIPCYTIGDLIILDINILTLILKDIHFLSILRI